MTQIVNRPVAAGVDTRPRRATVVALSLLAGALLAVAWSYQFVDGVIGDNVANTLLGYDAKETAMAGGLAGAAFAFVSGLACTFTACNVAAVSAVGPLLADDRTLGGRVREALKPIGWLAVGMLPVSAVYGTVGVLLGERLPQLSEVTLAGGMPVRLLQSSVVFGIVGLALLWLGLAALRILPDPLARIEARFPQARLVAMGVLVALLLIGRPFPLFFKLFQYAAEAGDPAFGALAFVLQALGNTALLLVGFLAVVLLFGAPLRRWLRTDPGRLTTVSAALFLAAGAFMLLYWDVRVPSIFGWGWFPTMPWN